MASNRTTSLSVDATTLKRNLDQLSDRVDTYIAAAMDYQADKCVGYMKENAPWRDRTSNARNGLRAETEWKPKKSYAIFLFHSMSYGIWLEIRWAGKYAIILPTLKVQGPATLRLVNNLFGKLKAGGLV